ncbi:hypothetical protein ACEPAF_5685 [Sanghuangporus sanghuang]
MSQSHSRSYSPSSSSSQTTDAPEDKGDSKATPNVFWAETSSSLDFLNMSNDELFNITNDTADEIHGSLERLESLLQPVEDGFDVSLNLFEPPTETTTDPLCDTACHSTPGPSVPAEGESSKTSFSSNGHLVQSAETIASLSINNFMDLLRKYAFYITDERFEFDRFTGEPVMTSYTVDKSLEGKTNEHPAEDAASSSDDDALAVREDTPTLTAASSMRPQSEELISAPKDENASVMQPEPRTAQPKQKGDTVTIGSSGARLSSTKRKRDGQVNSPTYSGNDGACKSLGKAVKRGNTANRKRKAKITGSNPLSTNFMIYRFGLEPVHSPSHRWSCPFPPHDTLPNGACLTSFDAGTIRSHIADHVDAYLAERPDGKLECPRRLTSERCMWAEDRGSLRTVGPNTGLPRHVTEVHLRVNAYTCPCGTSFSRGTRDQLVRHLRDGHRKNLEAKRKTDPTTPDFVDIDDPKLVEEENQWSRSMGGHAEKEEDDRGEGSSTGIKRARR